MEIETLMSAAVGLGLAAACGFRVFAPLLVMGVAAQAGHLNLAESFQWIGSTPAIIAFGTATLLEVGAYYVPFIDNLLDTAAAPTAVLAGVVATASQVGELDPLFGWSVAIIGGGAAAGSVQALTTLTRGTSSVATAGFGNPLVSTVEAASSVVVSLLAIVVPLVAVAALLLLLYVAFTRLYRLRAATAS